MGTGIMQSAGRGVRATAGLAKLLALAVSALPLCGGAAVAEQGQGRTEVLLTGYLFASALSGRASTTSALPPADIDLSFSDVLQDLDFGAMTAVEIRNGRWGFVGDLMYSNVSPGGSIPGFPALQAGLRQKNLTLQGNIFYRIHEAEGVTFDLGAGLRYWKLNSEGGVGPAGGPTLTFADEANWIDPVIAARFRSRLNDRFSVTFAADVGGFGAGSDLSYQLLGTLDYQKNERLTLRAGYRVLSVDYNDGGFVYDITMQGPVIGMTYRF